MDLHLTPLLRAGLIERKGDVYRLVSEQPIAEILRRLLAELGSSIAD